MKRQEPGGLLFWLTIAALLFVVVPYGFLGESEPRFLHLPLWFHLSLGGSVAIAALSAWRIVRHWGERDDD